MVRISELRTRVERELGQLQAIQANIANTQASLAKLQEQALDIEQTQIIIQKVATRTQEQLSFYVSDMATAAIQAVFPEETEYKCLLEFVQRRARTEADIWLVDSSGNKIKPSDQDGGGLINVVAFALRIAIWSLTKSSRPTMILDEPWRDLHSREYQERAAELMKTISRHLTLQFIVITGEDETPEIVNAADRIFMVKKIKGVSAINCLLN